MTSDPAATLRDGGFIQRAYELAEEAARQGDHPFGALLVRDGKVLIEARNRIASACDVTRHAEVEAVSAAWAQLDPGVIAASTLYCSTEPCLMCAGAIHWAGIGRVVYGVPAQALATIVGEPATGLPLRELVQRAGYGFTVVGPVMADDGLPLHRQYWERAAARR